MKPIATFLLALFAVWLPTAAAASPIAYDEAISGDLGATAPFTQFALDLGVNSIKGTMLFQPSTVTIDQDPFAFVIPAGERLASVTFGFDASLTPGMTTASAEFVVYNGNVSLPAAPYLADSFVNLLGPTPVSVFGAGLPLGSGLYSVFPSVYGGGRITPGLVDWSARYTWLFTVERDATVPEPGSLFLLGTGAAALVTRLRRRASRRSRL